MLRHSIVDDIIAVYRRQPNRRVKFVVEGEEAVGDGVHRSLLHTSSKKSWMMAWMMDLMGRTKQIWGGSPAVTTIENRVNGKFTDDEGVEEDDVDDPTSSSISDTTTDSIPPLNSTPIFVDNKRKCMEKQLSAAQRDQAYLSLARQELVMKQTMANSLATATIESSKAFESLLKSIGLAGKSNGDGLIAIASAFGGSRSLVTGEQTTIHPTHHTMGTPQNL